MNRLPISFRLLLGFFLVAVLPLAGLAAFYLASFEQALTKTVLQNVSAIADKKIDQIDVFIAERLADARIFAGRPSVREALARSSLAFRHGGRAAVVDAGRSTYPEVQALLDPTPYHDLLLIDAEGNVVYSVARETDLGTNLRTGPHRDTGLAQSFRQAMQTLDTDITSFRPYAPSGSMPAGFVVTPVFDANGSLLGALALQINIDELTQVVSDRTGLGLTGETGLAQRSGNDILFTAPLRRVSAAAFRHRLPFGAAPLPMQRALSGEHGSGIARDYADVEVAAAWRYLPALGWGMVAKIDTEEAFAPAREARRFTWFALAAFLLVSGVAAAWFGRSIVRPVAALTDAAARIAQGERNSRAPGGGGPELTRMAESFNRMADQVAEAQANLEAKVAERTAELASSFALQSAILGNAAYAIVATAPDGTITVFNRAAERMLGYAQEELIGRRPPVVFHDKDEIAERARQFGAELGIDLEPGFEVFVARSRHDLPNEYEWTYVRKDGSRFPVLLSVTALRDAEGGITGFLGIAIDITERKRAEEALKAGREQLQEAQRIAQLGSWQLDLVNNRLDWSDEIFRIFEIDPGQFGASYEAFLNNVHPEDRELVNRAYMDSVANQSPYEITHRLLFPDGRVKFVHERAETLYATDGTPILSRGTTQDITAAKLAGEALELYADVFRHSGEAIMITDRDNRIVAINPSFTKHTGFTIEDLRGKNPRALASGRTPRETYEAMWAALNETGYWQGELWDRRKDGGTYPKWAAISVIRDEAGKIAHHIASFTDISERKAAEDRIYQLAHHDSLTGLLNRFSLQDRLEQALLSTHRDGAQLAVMFLDMDRFKTINDTLGHHAGDAMLVEVAQRLRTKVRENDIVARLGGDEFVVVLPDMADGLAAAYVADKIVRLLSEPYRIDNKELHSSPSVGISVYPTDGKDVETLMKNADTAMYHAKERGRKNYQFFTSAMNAAASERLELEHGLRTALTEGLFELHYQPQILTRDGSIFGVEALVRWRHPERGLIPPLKFIPIAEETGLIEDIGEWVLDEACRQQADWRRQGVSALRMAVNLSAHQLRSPALVERVQAIMARHGIGDGDLELEITESAMMKEPEQAIGQLNALRGLGVELAIDDFGTGYSSLAYLKRLPIQTLKLDRTFVSDIEQDENDAAICTATLALAHSLGLKVIAEGVETEAQRDFMASHQCDVVQGDLFSKPLPAVEAAAFLARKNL